MEVYGSLKNQKRKKSKGFTGFRRKSLFMSLAFAEAQMQKTALSDSSDSVFLKTTKLCGLYRAYTHNIVDNLAAPHFQNLRRRL